MRKQLVCENAMRAVKYAEMEEYYEYHVQKYKKQQ